MTRPVRWGEAPQGAQSVPDYFGTTSKKYPGKDDQAGVAKYLATLAEARGLPPELPVMVGLVETGLRNLPHMGAKNDFDSVGMFQQRANWGSVKERTHVPTAAAKFLDVAKKSLNARVVNWQEGGRVSKGGKARKIQLNDTLGNLIAKAKADGNELEYRKLVGWLAQEIQRSAFGERYAARYSDARSLIGR